jgi:hypothetical protein
MSDPAVSEEKRRPAEEKEDPRQIATSMTLADISIRNHVFAWILMFALIGFGLLTFTGFGTVFHGLGISQNPDVDFRSSTSRSAGKAPSPEIMETDVVDILEEAVTSVEGVKQVTSTSRQGAANIVVEFELERNIDVAMQDVQSKISQAQARLPRGMDPPIVSKSNPEDEPIMRLAVAGSRPPTFVADYIRNVIRPQLQTISGVGEIQMSGFRDRSVARLVRRGAARGEGPDRRGREQRDPARAPRGSGRAHRERGARDERARGGRGDRPRGLPPAGARLPRRRARAAQRRRGGRGRARGSPPRLPRDGRARDRLRHHQAARRERGPGGPRTCARAWP